MGKHSYGGYVICPFYKYEEQQIICCEGVDDNTALHLTFASKRDIREYRKAKCENAYKTCMICQMLNRKYDYE